VAAEGTHHLGVSRGVEKSQIRDKKTHLAKAQAGG
jgi:hypothetical protein